MCAEFSALSMEQGMPEEKLGSVNDVKECEEARCPNCMEHLIMLFSSSVPPMGRAAGLTFATPTTGTPVL